MIKETSGAVLQQKQARGTQRYSAARSIFSYNLQMKIQ